MAVAADVMTRHVITIPTGASVNFAIGVLVQHRISGAPIVDKSGRLLGIVTQFQLLEVIFDDSVHNRTVDACMTTDVVAVDEDTPIDEVASVLLLRRFRRVPVMRGNSLVGVVSRHDLLEFARRQHRLPGLLQLVGEINRGDISRNTCVRNS